MSDVRRVFVNILDVDVTENETISGVVAFDGTHALMPWGYHEAREAEIGRLQLGYRRAAQALADAKKRIEGLEQSIERLRQERNDAETAAHVQASENRMLRERIEELEEDIEKRRREVAKAEGWARWREVPEADPDEPDGFPGKRERPVVPIKPSQMFELPQWWRLRIMEREAELKDARDDSTQLRNENNLLHRRWVKSRDEIANLRARVEEFEKRVMIGRGTYVIDKRQIDAAWARARDLDDIGEGYELALLELGITPQREREYRTVALEDIATRGCMFCGCEDMWFDRTFIDHGAGERMHDICSNCARPQLDRDELVALWEDDDE